MRREWPTDIGPVDPYCRDQTDRWIAVEIKRRVATIDAVEQLTRHLERIRSTGDGGLPRRARRATDQAAGPDARRARGIACVGSVAIVRGERASRTSIAVRLTGSSRCHKSRAHEARRLFGAILSGMPLPRGRLLPKLPDRLRSSPPVVHRNLAGEQRCGLTGATQMEPRCRRRRVHVDAADRPPGVVSPRGQNASRCASRSRRPAVSEPARRRDAVNPGSSWRSSPTGLALGCRLHGGRRGRPNRSPTRGPPRSRKVGTSTVAKSPGYGGLRERERHRDAERRGRTWPPTSRHAGDRWARPHVTPGRAHMQCSGLNQRWAARRTVTPQSRR